MEKDKHITNVIFRKYKDDGDILALFPYNISTYKGDVECYQHVGQHGSADYHHCVYTLTVPATEEEYSDLKKELENHFGYNLAVIHRRNYDTYLKAYHESKKVA